MGKALHTHFLVLSETDVKPGGPPDGKNGILCTLFHRRSALEQFGGYVSAI